LLEFPLIITIISLLVMLCPFLILLNSNDKNYESVRGGVSLHGNVFNYSFFVALRPLRHVSRVQFVSSSSNINIATDCSFVVRIFAYLHTCISFYLNLTLQPYCKLITNGARYSFGFLFEGLNFNFGFSY